MSERIDRLSGKDLYGLVTSQNFLDKLSAAARHAYDHNTCIFEIVRVAGSGFSFGALSGWESYFGILTSKGEYPFARVEIDYNDSSNVVATLSKPAVMDREDIYVHRPLLGMEGFIFSKKNLQIILHDGGEKIMKEREYRESGTESEKLNWDELASEVEEEATGLEDILNECKTGKEIVDALVRKLGYKAYLLDYAYSNKGYRPRFKPQIFNSFSAAVPY